MRHSTRSGKHRTTPTFGLCADGRDGRTSMARTQKERWLARSQSSQTFRTPAKDRHIITPIVGLCATIPAMHHNNPRRDARTPYILLSHSYRAND